MVFPLIDGIAKVNANAAHEPVSVRVCGEIKTLPDGEPPLPKYCVRPIAALPEPDDRRAQPRRVIV